MITVQNFFARYKKQIVIMMTILVVLNWLSLALRGSLPPFPGSMRGE